MEPVPFLYITSGFAVFFLWLKFFYFFRLFRPTAAFIRMIVEMLKDIRVFLLVFFIGIFAFSNAYYVFDLYTDNLIDKWMADPTKNPDEAPEKIAGESFIDAFIYTYQQSLGELGSDGFDDSYSPTVFWIVFFCSTILLQITLLNLLIAIMGDTFGRVLEVSAESQIKEICVFIVEYSFLIKTKEIANNSTIFIASLEADDEDSESSWEGALSVLKQFFTK